MPKRSNRNVDKIMDVSKYLPWAESRCAKLKNGKWKEILRELKPDETYKNTVDLYYYIDSNKHINDEITSKGFYIF